MYHQVRHSIEAKTIEADLIESGPTIYFDLKILE